MNSEEIKKISSYRGDFIEEYWKPAKINPTRNYVDIFFYWEFREALKAGLVEKLRPLNDFILSKEFIHKHERLACYNYTAFTRIAAMHQSILEINKNVLKNDYLSLFYLINAFEAFYFFFGSVLENIAGVCNIILDTNKKEDNFHELINNENSILTPVADKLNNLNDIKDFYRTHVAHRGRLGIILEKQDDLIIPYIRSKIKSVAAEYGYTWRKEFLEFYDKRLKFEPIPQLCFHHLRLLEDVLNEVFKLLIPNVKSYLIKNNAKFCNKSFLDMSIQKPDEAKWIQYLCLNEIHPHVNLWFHNIDNELPQTCNMKDCNSMNIKPLFYVKD